MIFAFPMLYGKTRPNFGPNFSIITSKYANKHYIKKTSTCYSGPRNDVCSFLDYTAKQGQVLGQFPQLSLLNMSRNIILGLLRLLIISYGTVTVTVYGYRPDTAVYGYSYP